MPPAGARGGPAALRGLRAAGAPRARPGGLGQARLLARGVTPGTAARGCAAPSVHPSLGVFSLIPLRAVNYLAGGMAGVAPWNQMLPVLQSSVLRLESKSVVFHLGDWHGDGFERILIFKEESNHENTACELPSSCYRAERFLVGISHTRELLQRVL